MDGLVVAMSLIGAMAITFCSRSVTDLVGRRPMLILSSVFYFVSGFIMLWSRNVYVLLVARLLDGFGVGLVVTFVPLYISEIAPSEIRGSLNTLPHFAGSGGMFMSYCMVFGMSLMLSACWRLIETSPPETVRQGRCISWDWWVRCGFRTIYFLKGT